MPERFESVCTRHVKVKHMNWNICLSEQVHDDVVLKRTLSL